MSAIKNKVVNTVEVTDKGGLTEQFIFSTDQTALYGVHAATLIALASMATEQEFKITEKFLCKRNESFTGQVFIGVMGDRISITDYGFTFVMDTVSAFTYVLEPFGFSLPDLVPMINSQPYSCEGLTCWLIEDLTGYYSGQDSDIWILTSQGMLIVTEELRKDDEDRTPYLSPVAVFDLTRQWSEEEVKNSELIKNIIQASN